MVENRVAALKRSIGASRPSLWLIWPSQADWRDTARQRGLFAPIMHRGQRRHHQDCRRDKRFLTATRSTSDTVLAIFPGIPFMVTHDNHSPIWNVPMYARNPWQSIRFSPPQP